MRTFSTFLKTSIFVFFLFLIYKTIEISLLNVFVCVIALIFSNTVHSIIHELGHLIGGLVSDYKLLQLKLGPLTISKAHHGKYEFNISPSKFNQCIMIPQKKQKYLLYNILGIIFNAISTLVLIYLYFSKFETLSDIGTIILLSSLVIGINKTISNVLPVLNNDFPNDMKIISLISKSNLEKKYYYIYLSVCEKVFYNLPLDSSLIDEIKQEIENNTDSFFAKQTIKLYEC